jgi:hypothetical protein
MTYSVTPLVGVDLNNGLLATTLPTNSAGVALAPWAIGTEVFGSDGKLYVFAKANATISASTAVCTVSASTFLATASGGSYTSPATPTAGLSTGDYAWFSKASV